MRIAIVGSGLIGRAWAVVFARSGHDVALYEAVPGVADAARAFVADNVSDASRVRVAASLADALAGAALVQENSPERGKSFTSGICI